MTTRERLTSGAYTAGWAVVRAMPQPVAASCFDAGAVAAAARRGKGARRLAANLRRVRPGAGPAELERLTARGLRSYARYWQEVFRLPRLPLAQVVDRMDMHDFDHVTTALAAGRGVVLTLPHMGNWDHAGAYLAGIGIPFTTVAERLEPASVFEKFLEFRTSLGMEVIPLTGGERPPFEVLEQRLRAGGVLCLLGDRDLTSSGVPVSFFGETATMPAGPASLALRTGAALLPATLWYPDRHRWACRIHPPLAGDDVAGLTQQLADVFAHGRDGIADHPQDWHMLSRLWQADLDPSRATPVGPRVA